MRIIVCGAGVVGFAIARQLASEENDVVVIDTSPVLVDQQDYLMDKVCRFCRTRYSCSECR